MNPPPPGPVSGLSETHDVNAAATHASTAEPPALSTLAPASAVRGCPAAIAPFMAKRLRAPNRPQVPLHVYRRERPECELDARPHQRADRPPRHRRGDSDPPRPPRRRRDAANPWHPRRRGLRLPPLRRADLALARRDRLRNLRPR